MKRTVDRRTFLGTLGTAFLTLACRRTSEAAPSSGTTGPGPGPDVKPALDLPAHPALVDTVTHTPDEWRKLLEPARYRVLREQGTEVAFTGAYWNDHRDGTFRCAACGLLLFDAHDKFESGTGWPSYTRPAVDGHVAKSKDASLGMDRDEVHCARCGGHLGHVFDDGPPPTGLRYCINSASLIFEGRQP